MKGMHAAVFAAAVAALLSGCGTVRNLASGDPDVYGGVQKDLELVQTPPPQGQRGGGAGLVLLMGAEICCSAVADTLTLPLAVYMRQNKPDREDKPAPTGRDKPESAAPLTSAGPTTASVSLGNPRPVDPEEGVTSGPGQPTQK
jgi:uncharacterized protein YceK